MTPNELALSRDLTLTRAALGNLLAALKRKQPPMVDQPDIEFAVKEASTVMGFPFDGGVEP